MTKLVRIVVKVLVLPFAVMAAMLFAVCAMVLEIWEEL
jgi:hypothetical protein